MSDIQTDFQATLSPGNPGNYPDYFNRYFPRNIGLAYFKFDEIDVPEADKNNSSFDLNSVSDDVVKFVNDIFHQVGQMIDSECDINNEIQPGKNTEMSPQNTENLEESPQVFASSINSEERFVNEIIPKDCASLDAFLDGKTGDMCSFNSDDEFMDSLLPDEAEISSFDPLDDKEDGIIPSPHELQGGKYDVQFKPSTYDEGMTNTAYEPDEQTEQDDQMTLGQGDSVRWELIEQMSMRNAEMIVQNEILVHNMQRLQHLPGKPEATQIPSYDMETLTGMNPNPPHQAADNLLMQENESKDEFCKLERSIHTDKLNCGREFEAQMTENEELQEDLKTLTADVSLRKKESRLKRAKNILFGCWGRRRHNSD